MPSPTLIRRDAIGAAIGLLPAPPSHLMPETVRPLLEAYQTAQQRKTEAHSILTKLERTGRQVAEAADAKALSEAIDAGNKDPGPVNVRKFEGAVTDARRHAMAANHAVATTSAAVEAEMAARQDDWIAEAADRRQDAFAAWQSAIDQLSAAHQALAEGIAVERYANGKSARFVPERHAQRVNVREGYQTSDIIQALREVGERPVVAEPPEDAQPLQQRGEAVVGIAF
jgi:uncharacterized protein YukE